MQCIIMENLLNSEELKIESLHMKEWHTCFDSKHIFLFCAARQMEIKKSFYFKYLFFFKSSGNETFLKKRRKFKCSFYQCYLFVYQIGIIY